MLFQMMILLKYLNIIYEYTKKNFFTETPEDARFGFGALA